MGIWLGRESFEYIYQYSAKFPFCNGPPCTAIHRNNKHPPALPPNRSHFCMPGYTALWPRHKVEVPVNIIAQIFGIVNFRSTLTLSDMKCLVLFPVTVSRRLNNIVYVVRPYKEDGPRTTKAFKFRLIRKFNPIQEITVLFVYEWVLKVFSPINHHRCWSRLVHRIDCLSAEKGFFHPFDWIWTRTMRGLRLMRLK